MSRRRLMPNRTSQRPTVATDTTCPRPRSSRAIWRAVHLSLRRQIALELRGRGHVVSVATVGRWLVRLGINRRRDIDPDGSTNRTPGKITARYPGHMVHLDVKKVGRIPDGGGWRAHGRGSAADKAAQRAKAKGTPAGYVYLHSAVDGYSRLAY